MKSSIILYLLAVLTALSCSDKCDTAGSGDQFAGAECLIRSLMAEQEVASFQVAVAKDGVIIFEKAFGLADVERGIPTTTESMGLTASIEKPFRSTALMMLSERGLVDLHTPVNEYLKGSKLVACKGDAEGATVARLMLHTTGLPYGYYIAGDRVPQDEKRTIDGLIALSGVLVVEPGTRFQYSNIGYGILSDIAREAAGEDLKGFITREIIEPLGLEHTAFFDSVPPAEMIVTQNADGGVLPVTFDADGYTPLYSTAGDLVRFGMLFLKTGAPPYDSILADSSIDKLWQFRDQGVEHATRRLAWDVQEEFGFEVLQHGGGGPGIHNRLYIIPSEDVVIAFMGNARFSNYWSDPVLTELMEAAVSPSDRFTRRRISGADAGRWPVLDPSDYSGDWKGSISGPMGNCGIEVSFDRRGIPRIAIEGEGCGDGGWTAPTRKVKKHEGSLLWRFEACIPYLYTYAPHDEVILTVWPDGKRLVGHAAAAREKDFGRDENYVLPQCLELTRPED